MYRGLAESIGMRCGEGQRGERTHGTVMHHKDISTTEQSEVEGCRIEYQEIPYSSASACNEQIAVLVPMFCRQLTVHPNPGHGST